MRLSAADAGLLVLSFTCACASDPAARRATQIAQADQTARAALASERQLDVGSIPPRTFAVLPFGVTGSDTLLAPLSYGLASFLVSDLSASPQLQMVERQQTDAILRELKLGGTGLVDTTQAPRVGRLVGARRLLLGDVARIGNNVRLSARVVDVTQGTVQQLVSADAPLDRVIDAEKALALLLFERLGINLTPAQRERVERRQTVQLAALVAYGRGAQADARGDAAGATAAFMEASRLDASFSAARAQAAGSPASSSQRASNVTRVLDLSAAAINAPTTAKTSEAADAPLAVGSSLPIVFTVRVTP